MLGFATELSSYWRSLIRIIYPANCVLCQVPLTLEETYLCDLCVQTIEPLKPPVCFKCAEPLPPYGFHRSICSPCRSLRPHYDRGFALVRYQDSTKTIFHQIKFQKKLWLLQIFFGLLRNFSTSSEIGNYEMIVPIPLDSTREWERGFNQASVIAKMLERVNRNQTIQVRKILKKKRKTIPQSQLKRRERLNNLNGVFTLKKRGQARGKRILLVDDIFTTGSTVNECARILKEDGAERVDFFTIARS